jgi:hypothetical protein
VWCFLLEVGDQLSTGGKEKREKEGGEGEGRGEMMAENSSRWVRKAFN